MSGPVSYEEFHTGFDYMDIYNQMWTASEDQADWVHKGRHQVLGRWHQMKRELYEKYLEEWENGWEQDNEFVAESEEFWEKAEVPF